MIEGTCIKKCLTTLLFRLVIPGLSQKSCFSQRICIEMGKWYFSTSQSGIVLNKLPKFRPDDVDMPLKLAIVSPCQACCLALVFLLALGIFLPGGQDSGEAAGR
jgi:hypothetical protein